MNVGVLEGTNELALVGTFVNEGFEDGSFVGALVGCCERLGEALGSLPQVSHVKGQ